MTATATRVPERTCVACRRTRPRDEMVRIARRPDGAVVVDRSGRAAGRGAYVCPEASCAERAPRRLARALRTGAIDAQRIRSELHEIVGHA